ncbi:DUF6011 domain-containing protein [Nonomuraea sp. NPDC003804]|uniref:DUF6011 domain-containing protein n=1 Tax=Nonomuraea sp. NPDC003804 TaxID=3154547 RepID=UPI0033B46601
MLLDFGEPAVRDHVVRCGSCRRLLRDPASQALGLGQDCAEKLGVAPRKPIRITGVPQGWDCDGQMDLLEGAT